MRVPRSGSR